MKRIGLLSDTHSYLDSKLKDCFVDCDEIWHAGDIGDIRVTDTLIKWKPLRAVYGNIDNATVRVSFPETEIIDLEGFKVLLIHIAGSFGKYNAKVNTLLRQNPDIKCVVCGHSHILKVQFDKAKNILYINPGAAGKHGFHAVRTALKFDLEDGTIKNLQVIELGMRGKI